MTTKPTFTFWIDWDNNGSVDSGAPTANEDVTGNVLGVRTPLSWRVGRDGGRSLSGFLSGDISFELDNRTKIYSPDNAASALFGNLGPGRVIRIRATSGTTREIFRGFLDDYEIDPLRGQKSVHLSAVDTFAHIAEAPVSTALFKGIRSGEAITAILDAIGWSGTKRTIDPGVSTFRQWWGNGETGVDAIRAVMASEGPPAICYLEPSTGNFVFRDRAHRIMQSASTAVQATFRDTGAETATDVNFSEPASYDVGFTGIVNAVQFDVDERRPIVKAQVWSTDDTFFIPVSSSITVPASAAEPFSDAVIPAVNEDYIVLQGSVTSMTLSRTSGQSLIITINAGVSGATIQGLGFKAISYPVDNTYHISVEDATSIALYGRKGWTDGTPEWINKNDATAVANTIITLRKNRLPVFSLTVKNANSNRLGQILDRKISDRVTIVEAETSSNHSHYIEQVQYDVRDIGQDYSAMFSCERVPTLAPDDTNIFILDSAVLNHRLDSGKLGN